MSVGGTPRHRQSRDSDDLSSLSLAGHPTIEAMTLIHDRKVALCVDLERIADGLPHSVDRLECLAVAARMLPLLTRAHSFEENTIFPVYETLAAVGGIGSIDRLRAEHVSDECFAADLTEILLTLGHGGAVKDAETFGFMLRGFFEGLRRHIAFEHEHVAPIIAATRA